MESRLWLLAIAVIFYPLGVARAQSQDIALEFHSLLCVDETDRIASAESDEVYILVTGVRSGGRAFGVRWPSRGRKKEAIDAGDWVIQGARSWWMWRGSLSPGESVHVFVAVMEDDGGNSDDVLKKAVERLDGALVGTGTPAAAISAAAAPAGEWSLRQTFSRSGDDLIGSFRLSVSNDAGRIAKRLEPIQRAAIGSYKNWGALSDTRFAIRMNLGGEGPANRVGHYHASILVRDRANRPKSHAALGYPYVWSIVDGVGM